MVWLENGREQTDVLAIKLEKQRGIELTEKELQMIKRTLESKRMYIKVLHFNIVPFREIINNFVERVLNIMEKR